MTYTMGMTAGQHDNSELSRFMNNGGGPEPHQGSNPGAQSDPGPREIGFYSRAASGAGDGGHASTTDGTGIFAAAGHPVKGPLYDAGQRMEPRSFETRERAR